jgi:hypothetical protein
MIYRDSDIPGLGLRATPTVKTFIVERKVTGKTKRISLGRYPLISIGQARQVGLAAQGFSAQAKAFDGVAGTDHGSERELVRLDFFPGRRLPSTREF